MQETTLLEEIHAVFGDVPDPVKFDENLYDIDLSFQTSI
jgi:hypothetical protein